MQLLQQLLRRQLLPVLLVLADDGDLPLVDHHRVLVLPVPDGAHLLVDVRVAEAVVALQAGDEDLVGRGLAGPVAEVRHAPVLHQDPVKEGEIGSIALGRHPGCHVGQLVLDLGNQHL